MAVVQSVPQKTFCYAVSVKIYEIIKVATIIGLRKLCGTFQPFSHSKALMESSPHLKRTPNRHGFKYMGALCKVILRKFKGQLIIESNALGRLQHACRQAGLEMTCRAS